VTRLVTRSTGSTRIAGRLTQADRPLAQDPRVVSISPDRKVSSTMDTAAAIGAERMMQNLG
jgi:hypothetical protein